MNIHEYASTQSFHSVSERKHCTK